jgi:hypothetical protein|uniref:Uncharacterized protein n=1 Tax=Myoviridae sp. ctx322 TaxID=2826711 RepID=A0A8S5NAR3_9CAUD|nr:MAG TPA: hypothetical protein [Myoviridae sp. ctx322]
MEREELEIIYIALYNQILLYSNILENEEMDTESRGLTEYLLNQTKAVEEKYRNLLDPQNIEPHIIDRPKW